MLWRVCGLLALLFMFSSFTTNNDTIEQQRKYDYFFFEATRLKQQNDFAEAYDLYKHCLSIIPDAPSALYEIAQLYFMLNQVQAGEEAMVKAVEGDPDNYWYNQALASIYQQQGKSEQAEQQFEEMAKRFPNKQEPFFGLLDVYGRTKNYEKIIATLNSLEHRIGKSEQLTMEKFRIYTQMGNIKQAFKEIQGLVDEYPLDMRYQCILGDAYMQNGELKKAYKVYQKVLSVEPKNPQALYSLANYYKENKEPDLYEAQIDTLLLNDGVEVELKLSLLRQLIARNEHEKGDSLRIIHLFDEIIEQDREDDVQIPVLYIQYLLSKNMNEETVPVLDRILRLDPTHSQARLTLLSQAIRKQDMEWIARICKPGVEETPDVMEFHFYLGLAYYQLERLDEALEVFLKALEKAPTTTIQDKNSVSDYYQMIGDIYHTKKKIEEAYSAYEQALTYNANNLGVLNNYAYYLSLEKKDLDRAEEMSYRTIKAEPDNSTYLDTYAWILFEKKNYAEARIYIDQAIQNGGEESDVVVEHAGDICYMSGDVDKAMEYWLKSKEMGNESTVLDKKIEKKKYIAE